MGTAKAPPTQGRRMSANWLIPATSIFGVRYSIFDILNTEYRTPNTEVLNFLNGQKSFMRLPCPPPNPTSPANRLQKNNRYETHSPHPYRPCPIPNDRLRAERLQMRPAAPLHRRQNRGLQTTTQCSGHHQDYPTQQYLVLVCGLYCRCWRGGSG